MAGEMNNKKNAPPKKASAPRSNQTQKYLAEVSKAWSTLLIGNVQFSLSDLYKPLHAVAIKQTPLASRSDLITEANPEKVLTIGQILDASKKLILLGVPGAGKSTTLQYVGFCFSTPGLSDEKLSNKEKRVPILLSLKIYEDALSVPGTLLEDVLAKEVSYRSRVNFESALGLVKDWRDRGSLLVLLDGLDEVTETKRLVISKEIQHFSSSNKDTLVIVSSRVAGFSSIGLDFKEYVLNPLQDEEELIQYFQTWLTVFYSIYQKSTEDVKNDAESIARELRLNKSLKGISDNPLILRLVAEEYVRKGEITQNRISLYKNWVESAWERAEQRGALSSQKNEAFKQLEKIAWSLQNNLETPEYDIELLCKKFGLVARVEKRVVFVHQTLQEYLVSKTLIRSRKENPKGFWHFIQPRLHLSAWREPLLLFISKLPVKDAEDFIFQLVKAKSRSEKILGRDARLAILLSGELGSYSRQILILLIKLLRGLRDYRGFGDETDIFKHIFSNHGHLLIREISSLLYSNNSEIAKTAAQVLRNMKDKKGLEILKKMSKHRRQSVRLAVIEGFSWWDDETKDYLKLMTKDKDPKIRKEAFPNSFFGHGMDDLSREDALNAIESDDLITKRYGIRSLGKIHNPEDMEILSSLIFEEKNEDIREDVVNALSNFENLDDRAIWGLLIVMAGDGFMMPFSAKRALPESLYPRAIELITKFTESGPETRPAGLYVFGKLGSILALDILINALNDSNPDVRVAAAYSLGELRFKNDKVVQSLLFSINDSDYSVQIEITSTLGDLQITESKDSLINLLQNSPNEKVRKACVVNLKRIYSPNSLFRMEIVDNRSEKTLSTSDENISIIIDAFIKALDDLNLEVRESAAGALGEMKSKDGFGPLINALQHDQTASRRAIIFALGEFGDIRAADYLLPFLEDREPEVRYAAITTFSNLSIATAVKDLLKVLKDGYKIRYGYANDEIAKAIIECQKAVLPSLRDSKENRKELNSIVRAAKRYNLPELLMYATNELEILELKYIDPITYRPPRHKARVLLNIVTLFFLIVVVSSIAVISSVGGNILSTAPWLMPVVTFIWEHPLRFFIFLVILGMIGYIVVYFQTQKENDFREESR